MKITHALYIVDNFDGDKTRYWIFAGQINGEWFSDSGKKVLEYVDDEILRVVALDQDCVAPMVNDAVEFKAPPSSHKLAHTLLALPDMPLQIPKWYDQDIDGIGAIATGTLNDGTEIKTPDGQEAFLLYPASMWS